MPVSLKDQVALVVGASSGIGRAVAVLLARNGASVMAAARREDRLRALKAEMAGRSLEICCADATSVPDVERLVAETRRVLGPIAIMVYATGTNTPDRALVRLRPAIWDELISTNLNGTPDISGAAYQASKRGMIGLAHAIRVEEREHGIRTTVINPGLVDTEILEKRPVKPPPEQLAQALLPEHVAEAVLACAQLPPRAVISEMTIVPTTI
ncbi:MAG: SDR family NAD(P)-dependent oxidoreductase [Bryobacteraceae bacterium]